MNIRSVFRFLAFIMLFIAAILLIPLVMAVYYGEVNALMAFAQTIVIMLVFSTFVIFLTRRQHELKIGTKEAMLIVTLTWVLMTAFGANGKMAGQSTAGRASGISFSEMPTKAAVISAMNWRTP